MVLEYLIYFVDTLKDLLSMSLPIDFCLFDKKWYYTTNHTPCSLKLCDFFSRDQILLPQNEFCSVLTLGEEAKRIPLKASAYCVLSVLLRFLALMSNLAALHQTVTVPISDARLPEMIIIIRYAM